LFGSAPANFARISKMKFPSQTSSDLLSVVARNACARGATADVARFRFIASKGGAHMEREKELAKLINVLRRTSRMALQSEWTGGKEDAATFCTDQYNRVLTRLKELDPGVSVVFDALPAGSSLTVVAMASRQLAAYYED